MNLIILENSPELNGLVSDFLTGGAGYVPDLSSADLAIPVTVRTCEPSGTDLRPYSDTWAEGDTITVMIGEGTAIASAELDGEFPVAAVTVATVQAAGASANKIMSVTFEEGTYGGTYALSADVDGLEGSCGAVSPICSAEDFGNALANHPGINYEPGNVNISVWIEGGVYFVEFIGTLSGPDDPSIAASDVDLMAPVGATGTLDVDTVAMDAEFAATTADRIYTKLSVQRDRSSAIKVLLNMPITIRRATALPA